MKYPKRLYVCRHNIIDVEDTNVRLHGESNKKCCYRKKQNGIDSCMHDSCDCKQIVYEKKGGTR